MVRLPCQFDRQYFPIDFPRVNQMPRQDPSPNPSNYLHIVVRQGSRVSSETAVQRTDKTTLPFRPLERWHIIWCNILENMACWLLNIGKNTRAGWAWHATICYLYIYCFYLFHSSGCRHRIGLLPAWCSVPLLEVIAASFLNCWRIQVTKMKTKTILD